MSRRWTFLLLEVAAIAFASITLACSAAPAPAPVAERAAPADRFDPVPRRRLPREAPSEHGHRRNVGVLVFDGVELLDFSGPVETFSQTRGWDEPLRVFTVAEDRRPVQSRNVVAIVPDYGIDDCPELDILVIPGGETRCLEGEAPLGRFIRAQVPRVEIAMSVCNGAFSLAEAGFLDGLDVTTHSSALGWLRSAAPTARVHDDLRFCDNGHIVTAAGVSAGIDGALHLVHRLLGSAVARKAARRMEYVWADAPTEPTEPTSRADRARLAWYDGKWAVAEVDYRAIVAERPDDVVARTRLGTCLLFTGKGDEALAMLEGAARAGSEDPCLHHALGLALGRAGRHAEAVAALAHALEIDPSSMELRNSLGIAQADAGSHREAIENLRISFHYGVGDARTRVRIARSQVAIGDAAGALRTLEPLDDSGNRELATMLDDPAFDVVRGDPRFAAVVARVSR